MQKGDYMITLENTKTIHDLVQNAGEEYKDRTFIRYEKNYSIYEKTYSELAADVNAISAWIDEKRLHIGHNAHAAFIGKCSYEYIAALLGAAGAGAVAIPLDVQSSKEQFVENIKRSEADVLFFDWEFHSQVDVIRQQCPNIKEYVCLQTVKNEQSVSAIFKSHGGIKFNSIAKEGDCAIIVFTSGTTGRGKGVMLSNGNLIDNTFCTTEKQSQEGETYLNVLPINHVFCLNGDIFLTLRYGSTLCLCPEISKVLYYIKLFEPSVIRLVPMMAKMLYNKVAITVRQGDAADIIKAKESVFGKRLHRIVSGGGYLSPDLAKNFSKLNIDIAQGYGMSECSPKIASPVYDRPDKLDSVGKIVDRCEVRIVDGEIQVKSPSVMMGYYRDPDLTEEALGEDGWLRTGDLGYVDDENFLYLTGRKKNLIILSNGENVSPEGIENKFEDELLISDILVYGADDSIAAEVYPNYEYAQANKIKDLEGEIQKIVARRNEELPSYSKISKCGIRKHPFEKTSSKKIIREKYFESKEAEKKAAANLRKPENDFQKRIYDILSQIMENELFGIDDNFYECGLDSMGSVLFLEELNEKENLSINLSQLMENSTILKLEKFFEENKGAGAVDLSVREEYPVTNMQKYFIYVIRGNTTGNLPFTFKLDDGIDLERLQAAIKDVINAHPGLKGIVRLELGKIFRDDSKEPEVPIINLTEAEWEERKKEMPVPFAYTEKDALYHICIFHTESAKYLFFDVSHAMGDGITMNILLEDVNRRYCGEEIEKESYTFFEYILEDQKREEMGVRQRDCEYIDKLLDGISLNRSILNKREKGDYSDGTNAVIRQRFEKLNRNKILYFCKENGVSENVMFLTAFNYCIGLFSDEADVFSNSIHSGRTDSRWCRLAGPLFLTYYCRYTQTPHLRTIDLLKGAGRQIMETMKCAISAPREGEMFFQYQGDIININEIGGAKAERVRLQLDSLPFHMQVMYDDDGYYTELRYWENRFDRAQLDVFLVCYECVVAAMLEERSVRRLKRHMPDEVYPKHLYVETEELNKGAGREMLKINARQVKAYVLDEGYHKKPFGAWGALFIMGHAPEGSTEAVNSPYGSGTLYNTGETARILPDGSVDFLSQSGRTVLTDGAHGRRYFDLLETEERLLKYKGIEKAEAYLKYNKKINEMTLYARINDGEVVDVEGDVKYIEEKYS